jgi:tetratricopeptide (TPR) repeat protein
MDARAGQTEAGPAIGAGAADVELAPDLCAEISAHAAVLPTLDCYQVLGVPRGADLDAVRAAFFERTRRFHPDRYFNKRLGPYQALLHDIYKRVVAANEVLRDPDLRRVYDASLPQERSAPAAPQPSAPAAMAPAAPPRAAPPRSEAAPAQTPARAGSSLRARQGLRAPSVGLEGLTRQLEANREKGLRHFREAEACAARQDWEGAVRAVRMSLAFGPRDPRFHGGLANWLPRVQAARSRALHARAESLLARGEEGEALTALVEAFRVLPTDPALARRAASLAFTRGDQLPLALELAECAVALDEDELAGRKLLGLIYAAAGRRDQARLQLQRVWKVDPRDAEVRKALASL